MEEESTSYQLLLKLGEGAFSDVFQAKEKLTGRLVAFKRLKKRYKSLKDVNNLPEIVALKALDGHPNIIRLLKVTYDSQQAQAGMAFELMDKNLYEFLRDNHHPFDEKNSYIFIISIIKSNILHSF